MRIIIESDDNRAAEVSVATSRNAARNVERQAIDGGQPSDELLAALGAAPPAAGAAYAGGSNVTSFPRRREGESGTTQSATPGAASGRRERTMQ